MKFVFVFAAIWVLVSVIELALCGLEVHRIQINDPDFWKKMEANGKRIERVFSFGVIPLLVLDAILVIASIIKAM